MVDEPKPNYDPQSILDSVLSKKDEELLPWEICTLPSKGVYYNGKIPNGVVEVRPMGIYADKVLTTQRLIKSGQAIDYIFKYCVRLPNGYDCQDLLSEDRTFLLYYLRGITHGNEYEFFMNCPACDEPSQHVYNFNELWETKKGPPLDDSGMLLLEPFKVNLPYLSEQTKSDFWVKVKFLRGRDILDMLDVNAPKVDAGLPQKARNRKKKEEPDKISDRGETLDETLEKNINRIIVEAMGSTDREKIKNLVARFHDNDVAAITDWLKDNSPGIDNSIETDCPHCHQTINVPLPITEAFFRPTHRRRA